MIWKKDPAIANDPGLWNEFFQSSQKIQTIGLVSEYVSSLDPSNHNMMQGSWSVESRCSWHGAIIAMKKLHVKLVI
jgi:hypothetical protein